MYSRKKLPVKEIVEKKKTIGKTTIQISEKKNEAPAMRTGVRLGALMPYLTLPYLGRWVVL